MSGTGFDYKMRRYVIAGIQLPLSLSHTHTLSLSISLSSKTCLSCFYELFLTSLSLSLSLSSALPWRMFCQENNNGDIQATNWSVASHDVT